MQVEEPNKYVKELTKEKYKYGFTTELLQMMTHTYHTLKGVPLLCVMKISFMPLLLK